MKKKEKYLVFPEEAIKINFYAYGLDKKYLPEKEIDFNVKKEVPDDVGGRKSISLKEMYGTLPKERMSAARVWNKVRPKGTSISKEKEPKGPKKDPFAIKY